MWTSPKKRLRLLSGQSGLRRGLAKTKPAHVSGSVFLHLRCLVPIEIGETRQKNTQITELFDAGRISDRKQDLNFTKLLDNLFGLKSLAWHELPPSLELIPELTTLEPVAVKGAGQALRPSSVEKVICKEHEGSGDGFLAAETTTATGC
jgi:hypothetical protein